MNEFWIDAYRGFFKNRKILLGVTGSIAAFKAVDLVRILKKCGAEVKVILTESAEHFVTPLTLETLSENPVYQSLWGTPGSPMNHIELARWADLILVAPATANTLAEMAQGLGQSLLTTELLAAKAPVFIAPAMNPTMYAHPATQSNLSKLISYGYTLLSPVHGTAACGDEGVGRMMEPLDLLEHCAGAFCEKGKQKSLLINLGPTRSYLDPVRYFTNRSSGKMGSALAFAAVQAGYHVHVIAGPTQVPLPRLAQISRVSTTDEMAGAVLEAFPRCDLFFSTAAVLDIEFEHYSEQKIKKDRIDGAIPVSPTVDILKAVGEMKTKDQFILGFAAETENFIQNAKKKLKNKNCDAVFVNPVQEQGSGFEGDLNAGFLVTDSKIQEFKTQNKHELAFHLIQALELD